MGYNIKEMHMNSYIFTFLLHRHRTSQTVNFPLLSLNRMSNCTRFMHFGLWGKSNVALPLHSKGPFFFCFCFFSFESTNEALLPCVQNSKRKKFLLLEYKVEDHANASFSWCCVINWVYQLKRIWGKNQPILIEKGP